MCRNSCTSLCEHAAQAFIRAFCGSSPGASTEKKTLAATEVLSISTESSYALPDSESCCSSEGWVVVPTPAPSGAP